MFQSDRQISLGDQLGRNTGERLEKFVKRVGIQDFCADCAGKAIAGLKKAPGKKR